MTLTEQQLAEMRHDFIAMRDALALILEDFDDSGEVLQSSINAARRALESLE